MEMGAAGMPRADKLLYGGSIDEEAMPRLVVCCVDDTDDVTRETSTGLVAEAIAEGVAELGGCMVLGITRHQLLLAEGVPYTSHNSSMCFMARMPEGASGALRERAVGEIGRLSAVSADPGLCVADMPAAWFGEGSAPGAWSAAPAQARAELAALASFGVRAQREVLAKEEAYALVDGIGWLRLSEHGGTGQGVIGALAGVGLRLAGNDGRFRGKWDLAAMLGVRNAQASVGMVRAGLSALACGPVDVRDSAWEPIADDVPLSLDAEAKPVLHGGAVTLVCRMERGVAMPCRKLDLDSMAAAGAGTGAAAGAPAGARRRNAAGAMGRGCGRFQPDNDVEERLLDAGRICENCLFRRKDASGFSCMLDVPSPPFPAPSSENSVARAAASIDV